MMRLSGALSLIGAFALGTIAAGWWAVPAVGLAAGVLTRRQGAPGLMAGACASLAWGALLFVTAMRGETFDLFARRLGGALGVPAWSLILVTLLLPALLGGTAAVLGGTLATRPARARAAGPAD